MYEDIRDGIVGGDFSVETLTEFFDITAERLFQDSKDCKLSKEEIRAVAFTVRQGFKESFDASFRKNSSLKIFFGAFKLYFEPLS